MKIQPAVKKARKRTEAVKKIIERKFSKKEIDSINLDHRLALIESAELPRRFMEYTVANTECLAQMQMELDKVIVNCLTLGDKSYDLRTHYIPQMRFEIEKEIKAANDISDKINNTLNKRTNLFIAFTLFQLATTVCLFIGWIYG